MSTPAWGYSAYDTAVSKISTPGKSAVLNLTQNFKPNLMNESAMAYTQNHMAWVEGPGPASLSGSLDKPSTWTGRSLFPSNQTNPLLPNFYVLGGPSL